MNDNVVEYFITLYSPLLIKVSFMFVIGLAIFVTIILALETLEATKNINKKVKYFAKLIYADSSAIFLLLLYIVSNKSIYTTGIVLLIIMILEIVGSVLSILLLESCENI